MCNIRTDGIDNGSIICLISAIDKEASVGDSNIAPILFNQGKLASYFVIFLMVSIIILILLHSSSSMMAFHREKSIV
jgi:hypothetical protein